MNAEIFAALAQLEKERGIPQSYMIEKITQALVAAYKKDKDGYTDNVFVEVKDDDMHMYVQKEVVDDVITPATEITLDAARKISKTAQLGDLVNVDVQTKAFGRIAAQTAKQVIIQGIREAERGMIFESFSSKEHEILTGSVLRFEPNGDMTIRIGVGRGYVSAERNKRTEDPIGIIHVDSLFSPVRRCTMNVTDTRVGQRTDYDKLVLEVETDGSLAPTEAVCRAANIINQYMGAFLALASTGEEEEGEAPSIFAPEGQESNAELDKQIEDLDLSVRSYNCLKRAGIHSVRQLVEFSENDLLNIRNFGAKSIEEVKDKLISMDLNLKQ